MTGWDKTWQGLQKNIQVAKSIEKYVKKSLNLNPWKMFPLFYLFFKIYIKNFFQIAWTCLLMFSTLYQILGLQLHK